MEKLFEEFKKSSFGDWKQAAEKSLKGKPFNELEKVIEDLSVEPYYDHTGHNNFLFADKSQNSWLVFQQIKGDRDKKLNKNILHTLISGVNAIEIDAQKDYSVVFDNVLLDHISTYVILNNGLEDMKKFNDYVKAKGYSSVSGGFVSLADFDNNWGNTTLEKFSFCKQELPKMKSIFVYVGSKQILDNQSVVLSKVNEYFNFLTAKGFSINEVVDAMHIHFEVGENYFFEIAKFRAFRNLFAFLAKQYGAKEDLVPFISASTRLKTSDEKDYKNMLRATTEAMSAVIGGCDSLSVTTFDDSDDEFAKRIARNVQLILQNESYLDRVMDPSNGSYYIEELTQQMAEKGWAKFKEIELAGGYLASMKKGVVNA